jgi:hypothetical protein
MVFRLVRQGRRLAAVKTAKVFRRADDQAQRPSKTVRWSVPLDNEYEPTSISVQILIAWEKEPLSYPALLHLCVLDHVLIPRAAEIGSYRSISGQDTEKNLLPKANTLPIPETKSSNAPGSGTGTTVVPSVSYVRPPL